jgi:dye decolorizing peroxidase
MTCPFHDDSERSDGNESTDGAEGTPDREGGSDAGQNGASSGGARSREPTGVERRDFLRSALAIGGAAALNTTLGLAGMPDRAAASGSRVGIAERLNRQHSWDDYELVDAEKGSLPPARHLLLLLHYTGEGEPTDDHRREAGRAFRELESTIEWDHEGLLFTVGYSMAYFDRFDEPLPEGIRPDGPRAGPQGLIPAGALINTPGVTLDRERPVVADSDENTETNREDPGYDVCMHLASEHEQTILAAEELLWGGAVDVDGDGEAESLDHTLEGIFERPTEYPDRRVGFAGTKNLREEGGAGSAGDNDGSDVYPEEVPVDRPEGEVDAKLSMGFNDLFENSIPREDHATIIEDQQIVEPKPPGVFANGTIKHVSKLDMNLDPDGDDPGFDDGPTEEGWYQYDAEERAERMFSPDHDAEEMGVVGEDLGSSNAPKSVDEGSGAIRDLSADDPDVAERTETDAEEDGVVGHVQKLGRARFDMETRVTDDIPDDHPYVTERDDDLRGHDGNQEAEQPVLRRDFNTVDRQRPGLHFVALMRFNPYMAYMRQAMNGVEFDSAAFGLTGEARIQHDELDVDPSDDGILGFCTTQRRGNYLVPPLTQRALPHPRGEEVDITVERAGENIRVTVDGLDAGEIADGTVRFGRYLEVNAGAGVAPRQTRQQGNRTTFVFPAEGTNLEDGSTARLFCKRAGSLKPVRGTATVGDSGADGESERESESESGSDGDGGNEGQGRGKERGKARADDD